MGSEFLSLAVRLGHRWSNERRGWLPTISVENRGPAVAEKVREVFERRTRARGDAAQLLDAVVERDPTPQEGRAQGHLFVLARPLFAPSDLLLRAFGVEPGDRWIYSNVFGGPPSVAPSGWAPDLSHASNVSRRARGWALHSYEMGDDRTDDVAVADAVHRALAMLPLSQRAVLVLRYFEGRSEVEIADQLGISTGTVKSRAARGLAALRTTGLLVDEGMKEGVG